MRMVSKVSLGLMIVFGLGAPLPLRRIPHA